MSFSYARSFSSSLDRCTESMVSQVATGVKAHLLLSKVSHPPRTRRWGVVGHSLYRSEDMQRGEGKYTHKAFFTSFLSVGSSNDSNFLGETL